MAGQISLADIIGQAAATNEQQAGLANQQAGYYQEAAGQQRVAAENIQTAGDLEAQATATKLQGELNTQNARVKVANALGTNASDVSDIITGLGAQYRQDAMALIDAQNKVSDLEANNDLLTNPLGFLKDLLIGNQYRDQRDALQQKVDTEAKTFQNLNTLTQAATTTQNAISETLTQTSIAQIAEATSRKAAAQAADAKTKAALYGASSIESLQQVGAANFTRNMQAYNAVQEAERMNMAREEHKARLSALNDADAELQDTLDNINAYEKQFNRPLTTKMMLKKYYGSQGELGNYLRDADVGGFKLRQNGGDLRGVLGTTPSESYFTAKSLNLDLPDAFKPSMTILNQAKDEFTNARTAAESNPLGKDEKTGLTKQDFAKPEQAKAAYDKIVNQVAANYQAKIVPGTNNPYEAPPISSVLQSPTSEAQALARSRFGQVVLKNLQVAGMEKPTPELFMQTALSSVDKGEISLSEARDGIVNFYTQANGIGQAVGGFEQLNVPKMPTYKVPVDFLQPNRTSGEVPDYNFLEKISGVALYKEAARTIANPITPEQRSVQNLKPIDLTKPQDVTTALTILQSAKKRQAILANTGAGSQ
jgi:hypothetical protein